MNYRCAYAQHHLFTELIFAKGTGKNSSKIRLEPQWLWLAAIWNRLATCMIEWVFETPRNFTP